MCGFHSPYYPPTKPTEKKLTFEEWLSQTSKKNNNGWSVPLIDYGPETLSLMKRAWHAAQENM